MGSALKRLLYAGMGQRTVAWLDALPEKPAAVILYSGYSPYFMRLLPWRQRNRVPLIFDAVEWYDPPRRIDWLRSPYYWNTELAMRRFAVRGGNIIAISSYLEGHYRAGGCNTVLVPPAPGVLSALAVAMDGCIGLCITRTSHREPYGRNWS